MPNPWFRLYSRLITDPKIEMLSFEDQRHFVWLLCMKNDGYLDEEFPRMEMFDRMIGRKLGLQGEALESAKRRLVEVGLIDDQWQPVSWDDLQFSSDHDPTAAERKRKQREREREKKDLDVSRVTSQASHENVTRTEQNRTDTEQNINTTADRQADTAPHKAKKRSATDQPLSPEQFAKAWACYPKRQGDNPKARAIKAWNARIRDGTDPAVMLAGTERYCAFCRDTGKVGTETVKQAATFFGPDRAFEETWHVTPTQRDHGNGANQKIRRQFADTLGDIVIPEF
jgi:hypothetical protein